MIEIDTTKDTGIEIDTLIENVIAETGETVTEREKETETVLLMTLLTVRTMTMMTQAHTALGVAKGCVYQGIILSHIHPSYQDRYFIGII